jgi:hypothetical protein
MLSGRFSLPMTKISPHRDVGPNKFSSCLLLVFILSSLFHTSLHTCTSIGYKTNPHSLPSKNFLHRPSEGPAPDKLPPCQACICKRLQFAVFPSQVLIEKPGHLEYTSVELYQVLNRLLYERLTLSRAPPIQV